MITQQWTLALTIDGVIFTLLALVIAIRPPRNEEHRRLAMAGLLWLAAAMVVKLWLIYHSFGWVEYVVAAALLITLGFGTWYLLTKIKYPPELPGDILEIHQTRLFTDNWLKERFADESGAISIDAIGVKLETVYKSVCILEDTVRLLEGRQVSLRILMLKDGSVGVDARALLEDRNDVRGGVQTLRRNWACLLRDWQQNPLRTLEVREFEFSPPIFMLRVGDRMLVNPYLATMGYNAVTMLLERRDGASIFKQYQDFFDRVWDEGSGLSTALPAAAPEADAAVPEGGV